jgi:hypothetical protein
MFMDGLSVAVPLYRYLVTVNFLSTSIYSVTAFVVYWSEFLAKDPEIPGSISGATAFSEK